MKLPKVAEMAISQLLAFEKELLGFYLHEPPYLSSLQKIGNFTSCALSDLGDDHIGQRLILGGVVVLVKKVLTKRSAQEMAFVKISDGTADIEAVVFPQIFESCKDLGKDQVVLISGRIDKREEALSLVVDKISLFDPDLIRIDPQNPPGQNVVEIYIPTGSDVSLLQNVNKTLRGFPGKVGVVLFLPNGGNQPRRMNLPFSIDPVEELESQINGLLGEGAFKRS